MPVPEAFGFFIYVKGQQIKVQMRLSHQLLACIVTSASTSGQHLVAAQCSGAEAHGLNIMMMSAGVL